MTSIKTFIYGAMMAGIMTAPLAALAQDAAAIAPAPEKKAEKPYMKHDGTKAFETFDANKDGAIDLDEFLARHKEKFSKIDANGDNKISSEEFNAHGDKMREKMKEFRQKRAADKEDQKTTPAETENDTAE